MGLRAQSVYTITADSVKLTGCDSSELIIENHTRATPGFLFNTGNGRTVFKRGLQQLSASSYLIGADTLQLAVNPWVQGGNSFGADGVLGLKDNHLLDIIQGSTSRMRFFSNGNVGIAQTVDNGYRLNVNGSIYSAGFLFGAEGAALTGPLSFDASAAQNIIYGNIITFNTNNSQGNTVDGDYIFTNQPPQANSGGGHSRLIHVNKQVNRGTQDGEETALRIDFSVTGTANDLRAIHAATGNVVVETGNLLIGAATGSTSKLDITGANGYSQLRIRTQYTPSSSADTNGNPGDIAVDDNYFYYKSSSGWKRVAMSSF
ncbi:MAG TPA: hypothetical protein VKQ52_08360 [Puia sp.]|nr:hypothetical protein [Puia sp.]